MGPSLFPWRRGGGPGALASLPDLGDVVLAGYKESPFLLVTPPLLQGKSEGVYDHDHTLFQEREDIHDHGDPLFFSRRVRVTMTLSQQVSRLMVMTMPSTPFSRRGEM